MKKLLFLSLVLFALSFSAFSQQSNTRQSSNFQLLRSGETELSILFTNGDFNLNKVETPRGIEFILNSKNANSLLLKGHPDLPFYTSSVIIPDNGAYEVQIEYGDYDIIEDIFIAPSKGSITRNIDPETVPYTYADVYYNDEFFLSNESSTGETFILRDFRGLNIKVFPYQYNPSTKELRIYKTANIKVLRNNELAAVNELSRQRAGQGLDKEFSEIYKRQFLNFSNFQSRYTPLSEGTPGTIVVLAKSNFINDVADYVSWKREKGHEVILVNSDNVGTTESVIKTWVQNYFNEIGFTYLLIVGDAQHIPPIKVSNEDSDNAYAYVLGNDSYADFFVGRFSGESSADILTQAQRTVHYERDLNETDTWIENAFGSASSEGQGNGHNGGESDVTHLNIIKGILTDYGYTVTHVNETGGNNTQILNAFNAGQSLANYIGHGDVTLWVNTNFSNTNVNQLQNENKLPFIISVACVNGAFRGTTCFAESWLRAQKNGNPTGALAFLGSTINQAWQEPMTAQDEMNEVLIEMHQNNIKRTVGGVAYAGYFKMIESGGQGISTANTWTVFGDPSASLRTKTPQQMSISHNPVIILGESAFQVSCNTDGALVALSMEENGETILLGYAYVVDGNAQILHEPITNPIIVKLTVTAFNKVTYQENIQVIVPAGPFVVLNSIIIDDENGNNNQQIDYNETVFFNVSLENIGVDIAEGVEVELFTESSLVEIIDANESFGDIVANETITKNQAFELSFADGIVDQTVIPFSLDISDVAENEWTSNYYAKVNAPVLSIEYIAIDDTETGNNNGMLDENETASLKFRLENFGHSASVEGSLSFSIYGPATLIDNSPFAIDALDITEFQDVAIAFTIDEEVQGGTSLQINLNYVAGAYSKTLSITLPVGIQIEDWESNDLTSYDWENDATYPWFITNEAPYEGDYCLRSGAVPQSGGSSELTIITDVIADDVIKFYKKVSCQNSFWGFWYSDFLAFYIDGNMKEQWAGEVAWAEHSYAVNAGSHEFKWSYEKDASQSQGSDCAWIDFITLPPHSISTTILCQTKLFEDYNLQVFPNPANDIINFNFELPENGKISIEIYNTNGSLVKSIINDRDVNQGIATISSSVNELSEGNYFAKIKYNDNLQTIKFSVVR